MTTPDTRTKAGRDALDAAVLSALRDAATPLTSEQLAQKTGAAGLGQIRASVRRLGPQVRKAGNTRAMVYSLAAAEEQAAA